MRLRILLFLFLLLKFESRNAYSQIFFNNPSFEDDSFCADCCPYAWIYCYSSPDIVPQVISNYFPPASNGQFYVQLFGIPENSTPSESIGCKLNCELDSGIQYHFHMDLRLGIKFSNSYESIGKLQVFGGKDSCALNNLLWVSPALDSTDWTNYNVLFKSQSDISYITLIPQNIGNYISRVFIDNLSPIYCTNFNKVKLNFSSKDTSIIRGECVSLKATASAYYDSLYWQSIPTGFVSSSLNAGEVCPDENTTYIVAIRDTGCGHFWSYDTLRVSVTVPDEPVIYGPENGVIKLISDADGYLVLYDMLGRTAKIIKVEEGEQTISLTNELLSAGMYIAQVQTILRQTNRKLIWVR